MNLVINARDAMPQGGQLTIKTDKVTFDQAHTSQPASLPSGRYIRLTVSDTGVGMNPDVLSHIFEPFYTTKERGKGTGLGLSTVYAIVSRSNGNIQVYSQPEEGATFNIHIPYISSGDDESLRGDEVEQVKAKGGTETILLVEDEDGVRELAKEVLLDHGYTILEAKYGSEALQICTEYEGPIHLLLTDMIMPQGMSGRLLSEKAKKLLPGIKLLYVSGYIDDVILNHGFLDSSVPFLQKPFDPFDLLNKVREVLDAQ
jgi:CheY-like chemotaxis protein